MSADPEECVSCGKVNCPPVEKGNAPLCHQPHDHDSALRWRGVKF